MANPPIVIPPMGAVPPGRPAPLSTVLLSFQRFAQSVQLGSKDHVLLGPLKALHGTEKHTRTDWLALIQTLKSRPIPR